MRSSWHSRGSPDLPQFFLASLNMQDISTVMNDESNDEPLVQRANLSIMSLLRTQGYLLHVHSPRSDRTFSIVKNSTAAGADKIYTFRAHPIQWSSTTLIWKAIPKYFKRAKFIIAMLKPNKHPGD